MGAWSGSRYVASLNDARSVWYHGDRIDVASHSATRGIVRTLASLYDLQHTEPYRDLMTVVSPDTGRTISRSYELPKTREALRTKILNSHLWMEASFGQLPRIPDFMANVIVGLYDFRMELGSVGKEFEKNVEEYYLYCRENDLAVTHAIGDPQTDRSSGPQENPDMALRVVSRTAEGIVVRGAKQLATLAPVAHEVLVYMSPSFALRMRPEFVVWFALPVSTPGLKILCREQLARTNDRYNEPLASSYDEQDAMLFFEDVFVPSNRVFLLGDAQVALNGFFRLNAWALVVGQIRFYHRLRTILAVANMCAESIGVVEFRDVQNKLGELAGYVEIVRLALEGLEACARETPSGLWAPDRTLGLDVLSPQIGSRASEILREIAASGIIMQPSEADLLNPELRKLVETYMGGKAIDASSKARLFRLARNLAGDSYGVRQDIYETWNRGDVVRNRIQLNKSYDVSAVQSRIHEFISNSGGPNS